MCQPLLHPDLVVYRQACPGYQWAGLGQSNGRVLAARSRAVTGRGLRAAAAGLTPGSAAQRERGRDGAQLETVSLVSPLPAVEALLGCNLEGTLLGLFAPSRSALIHLSLTPRTSPNAQMLAAEQTARPIDSGLQDVVPRRACTALHGPQTPHLTHPPTHPQLPTHLQHALHRVHNGLGLRLHLDVHAVAHALDTSHRHPAGQQGRSWPGVGARPDRARLG